MSGADPFAGDRLGRLALTKSGLAARDRYVLAQLRAAGYAATISGAGPTVLVLHTADLPASAAQHRGFTMVETAISDGPTVVDAR